MMQHVLGLCFWVSVAVATADPAFDGKIRNDTDGSMAAYMIPPYKSNHASTLEVLDDGTLVAAWFSGEHEEASGCAIVFAKLPPGSMQWSHAATLSKREGYSNQNPVLFFDLHTKTLHLYHSQASANSGEAKSTIWHLQSKDGGDSWTHPALFLATPGSFPRNRIIPAQSPSKGVIFPIYSATNSNKHFKDQNHAIMGFSDQARSMRNASAWGWEPVKDSAYLVQPSAVRLSEGHLVCFFRDRRAEHIYSARSTDDGHTWSTPKPTTLPNNNAGIEANLLQSGNLVLVFNPQTKGRDPIAVALSADGGDTWPHQRDLQHGNSLSLKGNEFSYPSVLRTSDGTVHVTYTYDRRTIKYKRFSEKWIKKSPAGGRFTIVPGTDAGAAPGNVTRVGTTKGLKECEALCAAKAECTIFDWNQHSGHCFLRYDGLWVKHANDHVTSGCIAAKVKGCGK